MGYLIKESLCSFNPFQWSWFMEPEDTSQEQASAPLWRGAAAYCCSVQKSPWLWGDCREHKHCTLLLVQILPIWSWQEENTQYKYQRQNEKLKSLELEQHENWWHDRPSTPSPPQKTIFPKQSHLFFLTSLWCIYVHLSFLIPCFESPSRLHFTFQKHWLAHSSKSHSKALTFRNTAAFILFGLSWEMTGNTRGV